ncbi:N-acetyltransferase [Kribbella pittospori]|uniref:N-acetyltransferase n=1 Tax=Kribbella pittospori TaxID=722689 RepID=A0A4R0KW98_9ACTN|nr:GNAT family N-acetyltransferase [Kribbella pittospori]TCC64397.1 N-acetyltransferase [Kribbella pittospori]
MIRPATAEDADAVTTIVTTAFEGYIPRMGVAPIPMVMDYRAAIAAGKVWVTGEPIAGLVLLEDEPDSLLLDVLAVSPDAQGRGIGAALLAFTEVEARARGFDRITLYTNAAMTENIAYYPRHGYVETGRETVEDRHRVFFRKDLT